MRLPGLCCLSSAQIGVRKQQNEMKCTKCGAENASEAKFCLRCGQELIPPPHTCPHCGAQVTPGAAFCSHCGKPLGSDTLATAQASAPAAPPPEAPPARSGEPIVMQTATGKNNLLVNIQNVHGAKIDINYKPPVEPEALPLPVEARPEDFPSLLDRQPELQELASALEMRAPVEIAGESQRTDLRGRRRHPV